MLCTSWLISTSHTRILYSTEHFETAPFVEESFATEMTSSSAFPARALHSFSVISNPSVQCLYGDIAKARRWAERNDGNWSDDINVITWKTECFTVRIIIIMYTSSSSQCALTCPSHKCCYMYIYMYVYTYSNYDLSCSILSFYVHAGANERMEHITT